MKLLTIFLLVIAVLLSPFQSASAYDQLDFEQTETLGKPKGKMLTDGDVLSVQVVRLLGGSRVFSLNDGYQERALRKIINWINSASHIEGETDVELRNPPTVLKLTMRNGDNAVIEPAYNCIVEGKTKTCSLGDGQVTYSRNNTKVRLSSQELYDWLLVGWKHEAEGAPKDELVEETLYTRYFSHIGNAYSDFIMCPRIDKIERVEGSHKRHIVYASALNYSGHHGGPYNRIRFILSDTPEDGVELIKTTIQKDISEKESHKQCRW